MEIATRRDWAKPAGVAPAFHVDTLWLLRPSGTTCGGEGNIMGTERLKKIPPRVCVLALSRPRGEGDMNHTRGPIPCSPLIPVRRCPTPPPPPL